MIFIFHFSFFYLSSHFAFWMLKLPSFQFFNEVDEHFIIFSFVHLHMDSNSNAEHETIRTVTNKVQNDNIYRKNSLWGHLCIENQRYIVFEFLEVRYSVNVGTGQFLYIQKQERPLLSKS